MKKMSQGSTHQLVPKVITGMMRIVDRPVDEIRNLYRTARQQGINFLITLIYSGTLIPEADSTTANIGSETR